jgi:hypothetical protein
MDYPVYHFAMPHLQQRAPVEDHDTSELAARVGGRVTEGRAAAVAEPRQRDAAAVRPGLPLQPACVPS